MLYPEHSPSHRARQQARPKPSEVRCLQYWHHLGNINQTRTPFCKPRGRVLREAKKVRRDPFPQNLPSSAVEKSVEIHGSQGRETFAGQACQLQPEHDSRPNRHPEAGSRGSSQRPQCALLPPGLINLVSRLSLFRSACFLSINPAVVHQLLDLRDVV